MNNWTKVWFTTNRASSYYHTFLNIETYLGYHPITDYTIQYINQKP